LRKSKTENAFEEKYMQHFKQAKNRAVEKHQGEEGFSLVGIMMLTASVLTATLIFMQSQLNVRMAGKSLESVTSYEVFLTGFTDFLQTSIIDNIDAICNSNPNALSSLSFLGTTATNIKTEISTPQITAISSGRCGKPVFSANGQLFFCLQFDQNPTFPKDSFAGSEHNFAEVAVRMVDKWQQPLSCANFKAAAASSAGLQMYYRLYWVTKTQPERLFQKQGYYYATKY
jgi:hypothetical protein